MPDRATAPIDLLREIRRAYEAEAAEYRRQEQLALSRFEMQALGAKAYASEQAVRKIDATLRDWA
jgi:hypothetical protein